MHGLTQKRSVQVATDGVSHGSGGSPSSRERASDRGDDESLREADLLRTIEGEIIPRLMLAHRSAAACTPRQADPSGTLGEHDVLEFCTLILGDTPAAASGFVAQARADGVALESLYLELLAPAARHLGHLWTEDLVSFTEVSTGLCRLHQLLHEITPVFGDDLEISQTGRRILLAPCVGEQHTFGLVMVAEVFRRSGWQVWGDLPMSRQDLMRIVRAEWFDAVGLSAGSESRLSVLATLVEDVRMESRNTQVAVLVGGPIFVDRPDLAQEIGADGTAQDARVAPVMAEQLVLRREGRI